MKKSELRQIIREEIQNEIFGFGKKSTPPPPQKPTITQPKIDINTTEPTIEGIDATGKGYSVWSGKTPVGDLRQYASKTSSNKFDNITKNGVNYRYYIVVRNGNNFLQDHVNRPAYFTVSIPNNNIPDEELKRVADDILNKNKGSGKIVNKI